MRSLHPFMAGFLAVSTTLVSADGPSVPGSGWAATRYETLWAKSPFAVATPEAAPESAEFSLWGIAQIDGVSYASVTDKQSNQNFLLATDKLEHGLKLVSINKGDDASGTTVVVQKDGVPMTLKLEKAPITVAMNAPPPPPANVGVFGQPANGNGVADLPEAPRIRAPARIRVPLPRIPVPPPAITR